ncbi:glycosyltransferase [Gemmobacter lutimaris]|uniref:Glycosyltransferase n=1 Tax=Gemmobacter lutimaris TaxID=2306023 RepID=A0A398BJ05_9RHOB|nr:glycosyltransferase [Gemmobacter lutimaris]RID90372.1 glycosyltransferase [Gemmobacter lutimaris]
MSQTSGPPAPFRTADRLLTLQTALHDDAAAPAFVERAVLLHRLGHDGPALADARHAHRLDPSDPQAMVLCCSLGARQGGNLHDIAVALLDSPFASAAERRQALAALDPARLPLMRRLDLPLGLRLTLVQRRGDSLELSGTGPEDRISPLGQAGAQRLVALECHIPRPVRGTRRVILHGAGPDLPVDVAAPAPPPVPLAPEGRPRARLWIIMPLKDGGAVLRRCLQSVLDSLRRLRGARLVLVDDGSEQAETRQLLEECARQPGVSVTHTPGTLGFTGAVNHGLRQIGPGPVLLLNSDTWLPRQTLPRLLAHLRDPTVGTVTPLSNNAGSVCLPGPGRAAPMPDPAICERLAAAAFRRNAGLAVDLPSGNGFAMLIAEPCLRAIAPLSGLYDSGYYEEVDFCLRASLRGWRHVAAADCFVGHAGSVTYGARKHLLATANHRRLVQRFPEYPALYKAFAALDPLAGPRNRLLAALARDWAPETGRDTPPHPGAARVVLPLPPEGPLVLPLRGALPEALRAQRFRRLRLVPEPALRACGLTLSPGHDLRAEHDAAAGLLLIRSGAEATALAGFACAGATAADCADFETALLDILAGRAETGGDHAVPV